MNQLGSINHSQATDIAIRGTLLTTRLLWAALLFGQFAFMAVIAVLWSGRNPDMVQENAARNAEVATMLFRVALGMWLVLTPAGYFLRNQIYKRHWVGSVITPPGYLTGNLALLAMMESVAMIGLVSVLLDGAFWPAIVPTFLALAVQVINFPTGKAMHPPAYENMLQ